MLVMVEIADWVIIAIPVLVLAVCIIYVAYFKISTARFPKMIEFNEQIQPNQTVTILSVGGIGSIKKIIAQTSGSDNSLLDLTLDQTSYFILDLLKDQKSMENVSVNQSGLKFNVKLDAWFYKGFSLSVYNRSNGSLNATGKIYYEIKKPALETIKGLIKDFTGDKPLMNQD
jgi:preprotein translocase subunit YajC